MQSISFLAFALLFTQFSYAQKHTQIPVFQGKISTNASKSLLEKHFKKHEVLLLPTQELSRWVESKSKAQFELKLGKARSWQFTLFESKLHAENYTTRVMTENGVVTIARQTNTVFKGYLNDNPDNEVRLTIADGFIMGFITEGNERFYIEPVRNHDKSAKSDQFVLYKSENVIPLKDAICGVQDINQKAQQIDESFQKSASACLELDIALAVDYEMYLKYDSDIATLNLYMDGILNAVVANYDNEFAEQIVLLISERFIVACPSCDPWTSSLDYSTIFPDLKSWADGPDGFIAPYDVVALWTARDINDGVVGVVNDIASLCEPLGNTILEDFTPSFSPMVVMVTHEFGHLFGAFHNYEGFSACVGNSGRGSLFMDPFVSPATSWSNGSEPCTRTGGGSIGAINAHVASRTCMTACVGAVCENTPISNIDVMSTLGGTGLDVSWDTSAASYQVRAKPEGTATWTYTTITSATNNTVTGLNCYTGYDVQVRANCGGGQYGPPMTVRYSTEGINIKELNPINCRAGTYDLEVIINTNGVPAGGNFDITVDGNRTNHTYNGIFFQTIIIPNLPVGTSFTQVTVSSSTCTRMKSFVAPDSNCYRTPIQEETFEFCALPLGWNNVSKGANAAARWQFGRTTFGANAAAGSLDGTCMAFFDDDAYDEDGGETVVLTSPPVDLTTYQNVILEFDYNYYVTNSTGSFAVDVFDGATWVNVLTETSPACGLWNTCITPRSTIAIDNYINDAFQVSFTFDDGGEWQWFVAVDNFNISGFPTACSAVDPNFVFCTGEEFNYDLTQHDLDVNPDGETVTWYDGQPSEGTAIDLSPATSVDLTTVTDLWASITTANNCSNETQITYLPAPDLNITTDADTICSGGIVELCVEALRAPATINWADNLGNSIGNNFCVTVNPTTTTSYSVAYTDVFGCSDMASTTISIVASTVLADTFDIALCESDTIIGYDLTQLETLFGGNMATPTVDIDWYEGQPSVNGMDITPTADSTDLTGMPDIWVLVTDLTTNCTEEVDLNYQIDYAPIITCSAAITVNNNPDTCGAFVSIPLATVTDDNLSPLPNEQTIFVDYTVDGEILQIDFEGSNIDPTQAATLSITISGDLGLTTEYYDIYDENGNFLKQIGNRTAVDCVSESSVITLLPADLASFLADNVITFTADATQDIGIFCGTNGVEMTLSYMPASTQFVTSISNDYNNGGASASGFYLPGTTTVTYSSIDGCGNVGTCTVDITVNQSITQGPDLEIGLCGDLMNYDLTQLDTYFGGSSGTSTNVTPDVDWYEGQPSSSGTDITPTADNVDVTTLPDIWALITDSLTNCLEEVRVVYDLDFAPVITCPASITVNNDPDTCGAFVMIPLATATDDNITPLPDDQAILVDYTSTGSILQFDFTGNNIDVTQPATLKILANTDMGDSGEWFDIYNENGNSIGRVGSNVFVDCNPDSLTITIPPADLAAFLADNVITFTADATSTVDLFCTINTVEMNLSYTPLTVQYVDITNDYNGGGADASGFYLPGTTTVTYIAIDGCGSTDTCTVDIIVDQEITRGPDFYFTACGDLMNYDLTGLNPNFGGSMGTSTVETDLDIDWYEGQPSSGGTDITPTADATDLTGTPDIWVLVKDNMTNCLEEIKLIYDLDFPPVITCPASITVNNAPDTCGAFVMIPLATATDDNITPLPDDQTILVDYTSTGSILQFDFTGNNIDVTQPATLKILANADMGDSGEWFDIYDENGNSVGRVGPNVSVDCNPDSLTITIPAADLAAFLADNVITFTADATSTVDLFCTTNTVEMNLSYTPLSVQFVNITNDHNGGGADASGYYPPGTTTVTYTAIDGCGSEVTCTVDITVNQQLILNLFDVIASADTICTGGSTELCLDVPPTNIFNTIDWRDNLNNSIGSTLCVTVMPTVNTTYTVDFTTLDGCMNRSSIGIGVNDDSNLAPRNDTINVCEFLDVMAFDITQYDAVVASSSNASVIWYIGQPSAGGIDITPFANNVNLTIMPDLWALVTDLQTNCTQEVKVIYQIDYAPVISCPASITVSNDPDTCGAFVNIPLATAIDDELTPLPDSQAIFVEYTTFGDTLQFDFDGSNINPTQPAVLGISVIGDTGSSTEYYTIYDENSNSIGFAGNSVFGDCAIDTISFNISTADLTTFLTDNVITFTAIPNSSVSPNFCVQTEGVNMALSYESRLLEFINITNDYNNGGADASGFYMPGTTTVTYTASDGCGNTNTCSVDITVNQDTIQGDDFYFAACGDLMNYDLTQLNSSFITGNMGTPTIDWYEGQPSSNGTNITPTADSIDLNEMPDIWIFINDDSGCTQEIDVTYDIDLPPVITCPPPVTVEPTLARCGIDVVVPLATAVDDNITSLPTDQTFFVEHTASFEPLQFDFDGSTIDPSSSVTLTITAYGDLGDFGEIYTISDENGSIVGTLGDVFNDCTPDSLSITITPTDLATFLADNVITFTASPASSIGTFCDVNGVEMNLTYTSNVQQTAIITNDYNDGGADASGYYPSGTTIVTYTATDGCGNTSTCTTTVTVIQIPLIGDPFSVVFCGPETEIDLTQAEFEINPDSTGRVLWYIGQPTFGGIDITSTATATDLSAMPDIWVQIGDGSTGCIREHQIDYQIDTPPVFTDCPASIEVDAIPGICGAFVDIPLIVVTDDNITPLPSSQTIFADYTTTGERLQFDFDIANIDLSQPATLTATALGDLGLSSEYYSIYDELGNYLGILDDNLLNDCESETATYTISAADLAIAAATNNNISFVADATSSVNVGLCTQEGVEMTLSYTSLTSEYFTISNDYNSGGADASDLYPSGSTFVTYTAIDDCGNASTCTVEVIVNQTPLVASLTADLNDICNTEAVNICLDEAVPYPIIWTNSLGETIASDSTCIEVMPTATTIYTAIYQSDNNCIYSGNITISVDELFAIDPLLSFCDNENVTHTNLTLYERDVNPMDNGETIEWYDGNPTIGNAIFPHTSVNLNDIRDLWAMVSSQNGCSSAVDVTVSFDAGVTPLGSTICGPTIDMNEGIITVALLEGYPTPENLRYSLNSGPLQKSDTFYVYSADRYDVTILDILTNCSHQMEAKCFLLPIELAYFSGHCVEGQYQLNWASASELNVSEFIIERSNDGVNFMDIGQVAAVGNSDTPQSYQYKDASVQTGNYYYRLRIEELDGTTTYSDVQSIECTSDEYHPFKVFPNPTYAAVNVVFESIDNKPLNFKLRDVLGRVIMDEDVTPQIGVNTKTIDLRGVPSAVYFIIVNDGMAIRKVVKK